MNRETVEQLLRDVVKIAMQNGISAHDIAWLVDDMYFETAKPAEKGKPRKPGP